MIRLFIILFLFFIIACNQQRSDQHIARRSDGFIYKGDKTELYTGKVIDTLLNLISEYDVVDGMQDGEYTIYSMEGTILMHGHVVKNKLNGEWRYYYFDGQLELIGNFKDDVLHGRSIWYYPNGGIKSTGTYLNGLATGYWYTYDSEGRLLFMVLYDKGVKINTIKFNSKKDV